MIYEDFISRFETRSVTPRGVMVKCPAHDDSKASLSIGPSHDGGVVLKCFAGCKAEDIVAALGLKMKDLFAKETPRRFDPAFLKPPRPAAEPESAVQNGNGNGNHGPKPTIEKTYSYTDALGRDLYQVVRLKPKDFRQRHRVDGKWVWTMTGVERVLYRLPEIIQAEQVWVVEGEKDADNLAALGFCATCNVGGAGKWLDGYTATLKGKHVILCGDNDEPGRKHIEMVFESISASAASVRIVKIQSPSKDVSDLISAEGEKAKDVLEDLAGTSVPHVGGTRMPVYSMAEIEPRYRNMVLKSQQTRIDLGDWLPSFRGKVRPLTPGTLALIVGGTGIGKTVFLQSIAMCMKQFKTLMFELELADEDLFERFVANAKDVECGEVENEYLNFDWKFGPKVMNQMFPNLFICPESKLSIPHMEEIILKSELKMGEKPLLVLLDYAQLMQGEGKSRYERMSNIAEGLKTLAKSTKTVVIVASQVDRTSAKEKDIGLHSGKDSGSLENSAGLVLSVQRDEKDPSLMMIRVLKATKGGAGLTISCNFDGARAKISERSRVETEDPNLPL